MTQDWKKLLGASTLVLGMLVAAPAVANENFTDWDTNSDLGIDDNEFSTAMDETGIYDDWDTDDDGLLSNDEFDTGIGDNGDGLTERYGSDDVFAEWDANDDDILDEDEFNTGAFGGYDADDSGTIDEPEFGDLGDDMGDGGLFDV